MKNKKLYRAHRGRGRIFGGVCKGLENRFGIDVVLIRLVWFFVFIFYGTGLFLDIIMWLVIPEEDIDNPET